MQLSRRVAHGVDTRSRLEEAEDVYRHARKIADALDEDGRDLWAAGLRSCLDAVGTTERQRHLAAELARLADTSWARRSGLREEIATSRRKLAIALGRDDTPFQPIYVAVRDLAEHLELNGGRRWLSRLRAVALDGERDAAARLARLGALLEHMQPGVAGLPEGSSARVRAVRERLGRHADAEALAAYVRFALRSPPPSRSRARATGN